MSLRQRLVNNVTQQTAVELRHPNFLAITRSFDKPQVRGYNLEAVAWQPSGKAQLGTIGPTTGIGCVTVMMVDTAREYGQYH